MQLAHVAGPVIGLKRGDGVVADASGRQSGHFGGARHEVSDQRRDILAAMAERRHPQRHHAQAVEQVLAEAPFRDALGQVAIGRGDHPNVDLDVPGAAHALEALVLEHAHDLALRLERHVRDLVEQEGAAVGPLEGAGPARGTGAIDTGFAAEQLELQPFRIHGRAVEHHEGSRGALRALVQDAGDDLLAGAGRSGDEHPAAGRRDLADRLAQLIDRRRVPDQLGFRPGPHPQLLVLLAQLGGFHRPFDDQDEAVGLERLFDEIVGAQLDRRDRGLDRSVAADDHHGNRRVLALDRVQDLEAVEPAVLQPNIEDHQARSAGRERFQGGVAVGRLSGAVAFIVQDAGNQHPNVGLVVYDQNVTRHGLRLSV